MAGLQSAALKPPRLAEASLSSVVRADLPRIHSVRRTNEMSNLVDQWLCPICESSRCAPFLIKESCSLKICCDCRHIFWDRFPSEEQLISHYRKTYTQTHGQERLQRENRDYYRNHLAELATHLKMENKEIKLLDYGCSIPYLLMEAQNQGFSEVVGVDWDDRTRQIGTSHNIKMLTPNTFGSGIPDDYLDVIRFSHVLEHLINPLNVLSDASAKLRIGGLVYVTQPNFPVFVCRQSSVDLPDAVWPEHLHFFSPISLCALMKNVGLEIRTFFTHQNPNAALQKYHEHLDPPYGKSTLRSLAPLGDPLFGEAANYPMYAGENSVIYAARVK